MRNAIWIAVGVTLGAVALTGQSAVPASRDMEGMVVELRALRADLNRVGLASIRSQLLVGRLQLQEQRILAVSNQLATHQKEVADAAQARAGLDSAVERLESAYEQADAKVRLEVEEQLKGTRPQLAALSQREQQLRQRESELSALLADEQARWTDFNSRLDELERALLTVRER